MEDRDTEEAMYVAECAGVPFNEACRLLEQETGRILGLASRSLLTKSAAPLGQIEAGPLVRISADVATLRLRWCGSTAGASLEDAELRIVRVESGRDPVTEILGIVSSGRFGTTLRGLLEEVAAQLEREAVAHGVDSAIPSAPSTRGQDSVASP